MRSINSRSTNWVAMPMALLLMLAGCATVPTSGPVEHHTPQAAGVNSGVHVDPLPPANGASQLLVVEGFLHAMGVATQLVERKLCHLLQVRRDHRPR